MENTFITATVVVLNDLHNPAPRRSKSCISFFGTCVHLSPKAIFVHHSLFNGFGLGAENVNLSPHPQYTEWSTGSREDMCVDKHRTTQAARPENFKEIQNMVYLQMEKQCFPLDSRIRHIGASAFHGNGGVNKRKQHF